MTMCLYIGSELFNQYLEKDEELGISKRINRKVFRVSDTQMSYRQINTLGNNSLLDDKRRDTNQWRKFSFKELVYLLTVKEIKKYGVKQDRLRDLWNSFFSRPEIEERDSTYISRTAEVVIGCILAGVQIFFTIDSDGNVAFYDPSYFAIFVEQCHSHIYVNMNKIVGQAVSTTHKESLPITYSLFEEYLRKSLNKKEDKLLNIIRNGDYNTITVKKKNGGISTVHAERVNSNSIKMNEVDILKTIGNKDFVEINIIKRDGKVVNYKVEDQYKL